MKVVSSDMGVFPEIGADVAHFSTVVAFPPLAIVFQWAGLNAKNRAGI